MLGQGGLAATGLVAVLTGGAAPVPGPEVRYVSTVQEQPDQNTGVAFFRPGIQGPNVASGIGRIFTIQEPVAPGTGALNAGKQGPDVASGIGRILNVQEQPPQAPSIFNASRLSISVGSVKRQVVTVQEMPRLGTAFLAPGIFVSLTPVPPIRRYVITTQELPDAGRAVMGAARYSITSRPRVKVRFFGI